eukprot:1186705-Prorocentrum_minimum.AAC.2
MFDDHNEISQPPDRTLAHHASTFGIVVIAKSSLCGGVSQPHVPNVCCGIPTLSSSRQQCCHAARCETD